MVNATPAVDCCRRVRLALLLLVATVAAGFVLGAVGGWWWRMIADALTERPSPWSMTRERGRIR